ncbi:MAG: hypothetical protein A2Z14_03685 [Chloroflexi bacterium RBG_16_48_8]|nr:MAG: hypothetical protein A2Z14_03685 [Chloroflexi bacterium RBG_16_48_8]
MSGLLIKIDMQIIHHPSTFIPVNLLTCRLINSRFDIKIIDSVIQINTLCKIIPNGAINEK